MVRFCSGFFVIQNQVLNLIQDLAISGSHRKKGREGMEYDLKAMDREIKVIEERTKKLKELGSGFEAVERNADSILTFVYLLKRNISDLIE